MMPRKHADTDELQRGDTVVAVQAMNDVAEGAKGTVKMVVGQAWTRYMVAWDSGEWMGTIDGSKIVREDRLDLYRTRQAQAALVASHAAVTVAAAPTSEGGGGGDSRVPEHLLARARDARARK